MYVHTVPTSSPRALRVPAAVAAALTAALLVPASPAAAAHGAARAAADPEPPHRMSTVGGARLGSPGTQLEARSGEKPPALPGGLSARSWIVSDAESGDVLASHNAHWKLPPASTLKMLFADTVMPELPKTLSHKVKSSDLRGMGEGSSLVGVKEGQSYTVQDLWRGVFLRSGNDAVHVLAALHGGVPKTVRDMNAKAKKLRASDTHVVTPDGYDEPGQVSSAYDLTLFARSGMQHADFRDYASTARAQFPGEKHKGKKREAYQIQNTNRLLTGEIGLDPYPGIAGVKNGSTTNAGSTFTGVAQHGDRVLLVTCMHPDEAQGGLEVYKEAARLLDWGFSAAGKVKPVGHLAAPAGTDASGKSGAGAGRSRGQAGGTADGHSGAQAGQSSGGVGMALGITGGGLVVLAAVAYAVHRRWPMPGLARLVRHPSGQGSGPGSGPDADAASGPEPDSGPDPVAARKSD